MADLDWGNVLVVDPLDEHISCAKLWRGQVKGRALIPVLVCQISGNHLGSYMHKHTVDHGLTA